MTVTELRPKGDPNPEMVALLLTLGLTDPACGPAVWADVDAAHQILQTGALIANIKVLAVHELHGRLTAAAPGVETLDDLFAASDPSERASLQRLAWITDLPNPMGEPS